MAVVWRQKKQGVLYEVRSAGKSLRLYTDGVFHSQYNPDQPLTGQAWDLLMLPAFFYPANRIQRILVMGVGGGAVMHMLDHFIQPAEIIGVELNKTHLSIARRFFALNKKNMQLVHADAIAWLKNYQGPLFDMIIDDLFAEKHGEPVAVAPDNSGWFFLLLKHLSKNGVIVKNYIDRESLKQSAPLIHETLGKRFKSIFQFNNPYNENYVAAYLRQPSTSQFLRGRLIDTPGLNPKLKTSRLRYSVRRI